MSEDERFYIGELAERTGTSRATIRYYEREGVLPAPSRSESGYRLYAAEDVERLRFVDLAQTLGLRLDEIGRVLELVDEGREPCIHVRRTLEERLAETRGRIRELRGLETRLERALDRAEEHEPGDGHDCRCSIIEGASQESRARARR